ncbi:MAG: GH1 family beta-glucosidase [Planctomycetota bacterium]
MSFSQNFVWGVASAAFQIEGSARGDGCGPSIWDTFASAPGRVRNGDDGSVACDHVGHLDEDVSLIGALGVGAYRFSISWPRVLPEGSGRINAAGLDFYERLVDRLLEQGVQPWVTLFHWDMPEATFERGGWLTRRTVDAFEELTRVVVNRLGDRVRHWMPFNEPQVVFGLGHSVGEHAPGLKLAPAHVVRCVHHGLLAHGRAVEVIRGETRVAPVVGCANYGEVYFPATERDEDIEAARRETMSVRSGDMWCFNNTWFGDPMVLGRYPDDGLALFGKHLPDQYEVDLETIHQPLDFYGVNIYQGRCVRAGDDGAEVLRHPPGIAETSFGWPIVPEVLRWGPRFLHERYGRPVIITENGCAMPDWVHSDGEVHDHTRIDFLTRYLGGLERAAQDGADIAGYFHWSIMDNFEWAEGYRMRFGLVHVDYETLERTPKQSYHWYKNVVRGNGRASSVNVERKYVDAAEAPAKS